MATALVMSASALWAQNGPGMNASNTQPGTQVNQAQQQALPATPQAQAAPATQANVTKPAVKVAAKKISTAQKLVEAIHSQYPNVSEVAVSAKSAHGCSTIASTDSKDVGEKCEKDALSPMRTGKAFVEKEKGHFNVSLPLHDSKGQLVGALGLEFKAHPGQTKAASIAVAQKIASEMASKISSKATLLQ